MAANGLNLRGLGLLTILMYSLYGAYISSLYIRFGEKGSMRSADLLLFVTSALLLATTDLWRLLVCRTKQGGARPLLGLLLLYIALKLLLAGGGTSVFNISQLITEIGKYLFVGFIAFAALHSRVYPISRLVKLPAEQKGRWRLAGIATLTFSGAMLAFITAFLGSLFTSFLEFTPLSSDYYQEFGDYVTIGYACLIPLQVSYMRSQPESIARFGLFGLVLLLQTGIVFIAAQAVNSNKTVAAVTLISMAALFRCRPTQRRKSLMVPLAMITALLLVATSYVMNSASASDIGISRFRLFDFGDGALYENTSIQSRWDLFKEAGIEQLLNAPLFGEITLSPYQHSSILSVQTHLGIVGTLLFWGFILLRLFRIYRHPPNDHLRSIALPLLTVSIISSFFTWGPLWFLLGGLYEHDGRRANNMPLTT